MKKSVRITIIIALALCACLLITVIAVISGSAGGLKGGNSDCRYPYNWEVRADGMLNISVTSPQDEALAWKIITSEERAGVETAQLDKKGKYDKFEVKPISDGLYSILLSCVTPSGKADMTLNFTALINADLSYGDIRVGEQDFAPSASGETETCKYSVYIGSGTAMDIEFNYLNGAFYTWTQEGESDLTVQLLNPEATAAEDSIKIMLPETQSTLVPQDASTVVTVTESDTLPQSSTAKPASKAGVDLSQSLAQPEEEKTTHTIKLLGKDLRQEQDLVLTIAFDCINGKISTITSHTIETAAPVTKETLTAQDKAAAEKVIGKTINTIANAESWTYSIESSKEIYFSFMLENKLYEVIMARAENHEQFLTDYTSEWKKSEQKVAAKSPYTAYTTDGLLAVTWQSDDGISCLLAAVGDTELEKLTDIAGLL